VSNGNLTDEFERLNGKDRSLIHIQSLNSPTGTENIQENPQSAEIQINDLLNTSLIMFYRSLKPPGDPYLEMDYAISSRPIFLL
jgi:hypothetical protein